MGRPKGSTNKPKIISNPIISTMDIQEYDYDFRNLYTVNDWIWYVQVNELTGTKNLIHARVRTIYPTVLICVEEDNPASVHISSSEKDMIFPDEKTARETYKNIIVQPIDWTKIIIKEN